MSRRARSAGTVARADDEVYTAFPADGDFLGVGPRSPFLCLACPRQKATCSKALSNAAVKRDRRTLNFGGRRNSHKTVNTSTGRRVQDNRKGVYSGSQGRMSQNILRAPKGARHTAVKWFSTDRPPRALA